MAFCKKNYCSCDRQSSRLNLTHRYWRPFKWHLCDLSLNTGCTFSLSAFSKILKRVTWNDTVSATLYTLAVNSWFWCVTQYDSKAWHKTLWLRRHGSLKKRDLTKQDTSARDYTRASETRRKFPSTFLLLRCLGFAQRERTTGIKCCISATCTAFL